MKYLIISYFKDKFSEVVDFQLHFIKELTLGKNFLQRLKQIEIQAVCQENVVPFLGKEYMT